MPAFCFFCGREYFGLEFNHCKIANLLHKRAILNKRLSNIKPKPFCRTLKYNFQSKKCTCFHFKLIVVFADFVFFCFHLQGFHLSATVVSTQSSQSKGAYNVAVMFDRCRITSCSCTCGAGAKWCAHVVALCLFRIHNVSFC